jgi:hypothetical protein
MALLDGSPDGGVKGAAGERGRGRANSVAAAGGRTRGVALFSLAARLGAGVLVLSSVAAGRLLPPTLWDLCLQQSSRTEEEE